MSDIGLGDLLLIVIPLVLVVAVVVSSLRRAHGPHRAGPGPGSTRSEAEEELNLLKGGSLWGDVYQPRFVTRSRKRRR